MKIKLMALMELLFKECRQRVPKQRINKSRAKLYLSFEFIFK